MTDPTAASVLADRLAARLRALRIARDLTQAEMAASAGITRNHYQLLESGLAPSGGPANPRLGTLVALATAHGLTAAQLISESDEPV